MNENISPEEKLLRLIKGQKKLENLSEKMAAPQAITSEKPSNAGAKTNNFARLNPLLLVRNLSRLELNKLLLILFVLSCSYLAISLIYPWFAAKEIALPKSHTLKAEEGAAPDKEIKPYEYYLDAAASRAIFGSASGQDSEQPARIMNPDLMKDFNLVGIIAGENPQAVIEDKKNQKTYYVTKGQTVNGMQIEDIREGKIILNADGKKYELYL